VYSATSIRDNFQIEGFYQIWTTLLGFHWFRVEHPVWTN
jgi:hypothetical protein